ncbi:synaptojanin-1 isoform X2 [Adelges cooleyi]|uniref:synaptojanin-1 isoform X2 n=1 Tax=Adelges cooleyi TaxID=133065 RepID=UPI0021800CF4|nr:synaptojanin-1 isoform X2 [Adelges cooleyi]
MFVSQELRFDLTLCAQRQWNSCNPDQRFFWNRNLHIYFIRFGIDTAQWLMKIVCGSIEVKTVYARHKQARIAIISRLSCRRAGTRFNVRGCNDDGYVANFVETEQVVYLDDEVTSFVQIRGSVPLFWEQPGVNVGAHKVKLSRSIEASAEVYEKHVKSLKECYGNTIFINLLGAANVNSKENESSLSYAFEQKHSTSTFSFIPFVAFDYHQEFKSGGEKSLQKLKNTVGPYLDSFGVFYAKGNSVVKHQTGSMRINCTDCLDRTNCIQKFFALEVLVKQLNLLCPNETDQIVSRFEEVFQQLWVNNGNEISRIYAGTGAIQGGSKLLDGARSAARTIQNNLLDSSKQEGFDILLYGNAMSHDLSLKAKTLLPYNVWQCHPDLVEVLCKKYKSYTYKSKLRVAVATYNVNGGKHFLNFDSNNLESLSKWLLGPFNAPLFDSSNEFFLNEDNNLPDIYAIGFEEIVDLNASNIMAASSDNADSWNKSLNKVLSSKREYVLLTSTQLVGVCLFIFIKPELLPYVRDVTTDSVKTGMGGATGNKGAVMVRFTLNATSLCFICSHFAAGQSQVTDRNADFNEITRKLKVPIQSNDYVYWCGDFNYRVDMDRLDLINHVFDGELDEILKYDQLLAQYKDKKVFEGFLEAPITFPPTYKYDILSDDYDSSDKCRTPAWTDRVLWFTNENNEWPDGKQVFYGRAEIKESDHRPVMACYAIDILCVDQNQREQILNTVWNEYGPVDGVIYVHIANTDFPKDDENFKNIMLQGLGSFGKILNVKYFIDRAEITYENGRFASNALKIKQISINNYTLILTSKETNWITKIKNEIETVTNRNIPLWTDKLRAAPVRPPLPARSDQVADGMPNYPPPSNPSNTPLPPLPPRQRLPPPLPPRNT